MKKHLIALVAMFNVLLVSMSLHAQTFTLQTEDIITLFWNSSAAPAITDFDGDGMLDVYVGGSSGAWEYWKQDYYHSNSFQPGVDPTSLYVGANAAPAFADLDGDGLLDLLIGEENGHITHFEQSSQQSIYFNFVTSNFCSIDVGSYSAPTLTDFNGDGMLDLIVGAQDYAQHFIQEFPNSLNFLLTNAQFVGTIGSRLTPTFTDLDGDGLLDMFVAFGTYKIKRFEQLYANTAEFQYVAEFELGSTSYSFPVFTDMDGDGKLDMLIGQIAGLVDHFEVTFASINQSCVTTAAAESITASSAILGGNITDNNGHLIVHRGVCYSSTNVNPTLADNKAFMVSSADSFSATVSGLSGYTTYFYRVFAISSLGAFYGPVKVFSTQFAVELTSNFNSIDVGGYSAPAISDIDCDGLLDMLVGENAGNINHYEQDTINASSFSLISEQFSSINVGHYATPAISDMDGDGLLDLLVGEEDGNINHYVQDTFDSYTFTLLTTTFNNIDVGDWSAPSITDLDGNGMLDIMIGAGDGKISHLMQLIPNTNVFILANPFFNSITVDAHAVPTFTDLEGDGRIDMLIGEYNGEIHHYEQSEMNSASFTFRTDGFNSIDVGHESKPMFTDLDGDGMHDLLIGEYAGNINHFHSIRATINAACLNTSIPMMIGETSAVCGGDVTDDNAHLITRRGICYSATNASPTFADHKQSMGSGAGVFSGTISGLSADSTYYFRAFASSSLGPFYGEVQTLSFPDKFPGTTLEFDGNDDYVQISINSPETNYTYELFFKTTDQNAKISSVRHPTLGGATDRNLYLENGNIFHRLWQEEIIGSSGQNYADDTWHHVAVVVESGVGQRIYVDGEQVAAGTKDQSDFDWDTSLDIGYDDTYFDGKIDEVRLWNIVKSEIQIRENMYLGLAKFETGLIGYWQFNNGNGTVLTDFTYDGHDGTLMNMDNSDWIESTIPFGPGEADSQTEASGNVVFAGTNLSMSFNSQNGAELTVTCINLYPNTDPIGAETIFKNQYWVVNRFGTGTFTANVSFKINEDLTARDESYPFTISLFTRSGNADTDWIHMADASSVDAATDVAVFNGISDVGQFIIVRKKKPVIAALKSLDFNLVTDQFNSTDFGHGPDPTFTDIDGDNLLDMIIGGAYGRLKYYEQDSLNTPSFSLVTENFNSIFVGNSASPAFTDLDGDGLLDMIIGDFLGELNHYKQNSRNDTSFSLVTEQFNSIDVGDDATPTFTDLDGDGLLDMIIGNFSGKLIHYEQNSINSTNFTLATNNFNSIDIGDRSSSAFTDLDGDNLLDMIVTGMGGKLYHYEQNSMNSASFSLVTNQFISYNGIYNPKPVFSDLNGDCVLDLILGTPIGWMYYYKQDIMDSIGFSTSKTGVNSETKSYFIKAKNLLDDLNIESPEGFSISLSADTEFSSYLAITPVDGNFNDSIFVRFEPDTIGVYTGNIIHTSYAAEMLLPLYGFVTGIDNFPGTALEFDGTNDYVKTSLDDLSGSEVTIEYWFKGSSTQSAVRQQSGGDYFVAGWNDKHILSNDGGTGNGLPIGVGAEDGNWHHIAMTWKQNTENGFKSYLDGNLVAQRTSSNTPLANIASNVFFGSHHGTGEFMNGSLEEIRIWNIARDSIKIRESMHLPLLGQETGLIGYWQFNDGTGMVLTDIKSGYDGTLINMDDSDWINSSIPFGPGISDSQTETAGTLDFSGTGLSIFFNAQNGAGITVTRIDTVPNTNPAEPESVFASQYWVVNRFGDGTFDADLTFTVNEDLTLEDENNPIRIKLYSRGSTVDTGWTMQDNAMTVNAANNSASFAGITGYSQFILARDSKLYHTINLPQGWSGLSSYLIPADTDIEYIFDDIPDQLVIALTEEEIYYPAYNINTIGNWAQHSAYKVKTNAGVSLSIAGFMENNHTLQLTEGWNLIPVISSCPVDVEDLFALVVSDLEI
nr:VCBS repeat-containing protein [Bacteroidota bacterium]